jgi:hypothetical protein
MIPKDRAVVSVRPEPTLPEGELDAGALRAVQGWITLNRAVLIDFCNGETTHGIELAQRLRRF